jgi:uncharacterized protein YdeI (BOF family)
MNVQPSMSVPGARKVSTGDLASQIAKQREDANNSAQKVGGINHGSQRTALKRAKKARRNANVAARADINREYAGEGKRDFTLFHSKMASLAAGKGGAI